MSPSTSTSGGVIPSTFESLGIRTVINAGGTYTVWSGSRMIDTSVQAMVEATNGYVHMPDLMEAIGSRLAAITGAEWGYVTSGCAAAINQITAAAIAGGDPEKIARLPETTGMRNEIIQEACIRSGYEQCIRIAGGRVVTVETEEELLRTIGEHTALVFIDGDVEERSNITPARMIAVAREYGIPSFVDAAAQRIEVPNRYLEMGADAVAYSGGKCLRGPQATGLILGRKGLLQAAFLNTSPHGSQGRGMKVGKEEAMALLGAVEAFLLGRDHEAEWAVWEGYLNTIDHAVADLPRTSTERRMPGVANVTPYLDITWNSEETGHTPEEVYENLLAGEPRILVNRLDHGLRINPYMMEKGEDTIIADRLKQILTSPPPEGSESPSVLPEVDLSGDWRISLQFVYGEGTHTMHLDQQGAHLQGTYYTPYSECELTGAVSGIQVTLEGRYILKGTVVDDRIEGSAEIGQAKTVPWCGERTR